MIVIRMTGGMGNQMFQYALYLKLKSQGKEVKLDDITEYENRDARPIMLWAFDITYETATREDIVSLTDGSPELWNRVKRKLFGRRSMEYYEQDINFDPLILAKDPAYLSGYFQSEKYFKDIEMEIRDAFCFSSRIWENLSIELMTQFKAYLEQIDNSDAVAVHIRRGDYLEKKELYGDICTENYYQKAIALIREESPHAVFCFFCNDSGLCDREIEELYGLKKDFVIIKGTAEDTGYLDMMIMSHCRHHIIANSSFSWWGAWLSKFKDKVIVAPAKWNNFIDQRDIYTENMIRITPDGELV